ncbi:MULTISPECIES: GTP 3',8-cyclase MoaA [Atopobiaceae]|uniref:GTP 3',8-cyclase n=1 Tax=Parafannyhessea umbonata TaxID=604330 RepID=A0A1H9QTB5_9ACTN|nr:MULTISPECIES: GTP 3',8-cyclase MoaA [Atopobiaceae]SEH44154.1 cyclic pyranopterin monophosphate synthase subunit MoaA [Parafannyhessea umbonata]SER63099.1 cyclic pyranopterin monophosphate synthase subunit MoaA [Parafannyhessea umbonata]SJZ59410.1 cyclic pyranopterin phosphate synthase [Olsenella sp. KH1P3]
MIDGYGRNIRYLRVSVTDRCNCRCVYCMPGCGVPMLDHDDLMSFEELTEVVAASARLGVRKVRLTGGEPLVRQDVVELVRMIAAVPGIEEVDMTTNGTLLAPLAAPLREAGLTRVNVSLDTLDPVLYRKITRVGRLEDALAGLAALERAGFADTKVDCVLMGGVNDAGILPLASLAKDRPMSVRFIELMRMGECAAWPRSRFVPADEVLLQLPGAVPAGTQGVAELYRVPGWKGTVGLIRPVSHKFCAGCDRIRLSAEGRLKPCLHSAEEIPLRGLHGEALEQALRQAIMHKPRRSNIDQTHASDSARGMSRIGG